ncbi:MAG: glycine--tRNA ligase [Sphaerochaetaceae bacterium]|jgi:glycyl-tRNA synthetase|nr:glycine--tRNA ligase [Sphaerochaetaceae bacterium]NLO59565.1 glycine--tRNA ligase [Spirochaetales bacterium]MDD2405041.1 glycine--tRNA ligase [Sphaerochaetaceae bacterium]MDD3669942.1 glycine--tRNA ligase [Sphaerochaetaceae bacterium]MDD4259543.1 glycine--tRNA ligase [Sphaerochaetaceae bacterium]
MADVTMDKLVSLCKRRGFIYQSSEIYGGLTGAYDYGPLGVQLKNNIRDFWWKEMTQIHDDIVGLDASILMHPKVWEASGHVSNFTDPMVDCKQCKSRFRSDQIDLTAGCPVCGTKGSFTEPRNFNLMFSTHIGPVHDDASIVYLRPETAQGIYVDFKNIVQSSRVKIPFGIAQVGKSFRNEITTKNFIFRSCEFEQMEMQFFCKPGSDDDWFSYWRDQRMTFYHKMGIRPAALRWHRHGEDELAFYAKDAYDIQFLFPMGWQELEGVHNRTDYDLTQHQKFSGKDMAYLDQETQERYIPYVVETSAGLTRNVLMALSDAYEEQQLPDGDMRTVLHFHPALAPVTVAVLPLVKKDGLGEFAKKLELDLREDFTTFFDLSGAIGRRYRRMDEIGTPYCVTVDYQTLQDNTVTLRFRDSMEQIRVTITDLVTTIKRETKQYKRIEE